MGTFVFDNPKVITQVFNVSLPNVLGRIKVTRKEVIRKIHHMGCTDDLPPDYEEKRIDYDVVIEDIDLKIRQDAIKAVQNMLNESD